MGCCVEDENPNYTSSCLHKFLDFFYILVGVFFIVLAVFYYMAVSSSAFFYVLVVVGVGLIIFSIIGLFGSGYYHPQRDERLICLRLFFLATLVVSIFLLLIGAMCFLSAELAGDFILKIWGDLETAISNLPESVQGVAQVFLSILNGTTQIGGLMLGCAVLVFLGFIASGCVMGKVIFVQTVNLMGSIVVIVIGAFIVVLAFLAQSNIKILEEIPMVRMALIIAGAVVAVIGFIGMIASCSCIGKRTMCPMGLYCIVLVVFTVVFLVVTALAFGFVDKLVGYAQTGMKVVCEKVPTSTAAASLLSAPLSSVKVQHGSQFIPITALLASAAAGAKKPTPRILPRPTPEPGTDPEIVIVHPDTPFVPQPPPSVDVDTPSTPAEPDFHLPETEPTPQHLQKQPPMPIVLPRPTPAPKPLPLRGMSMAPTLQGFLRFANAPTKFSESSCYSFKDEIIESLCTKDGDLDPCPASITGCKCTQVDGDLDFEKALDLVNLYVDSLISNSSRLIATVGIVIGVFFLLLMFAACYQCCYLKDAFKKMEDEEAGAGSRTAAYRAEEPESGGRSHKRHRSRKHGSSRRSRRKGSDYEYEERNESYEDY